MNQMLKLQIAQRIMIQWIFQLGSLHCDDEAELDPQLGWHADDPCFDPDVGYLQP